MARLSLSLLGQFQVMLDDQPVTAFESDRVRALLAYLAVEADRPHSRDVLAGLLWPDQPEQAARTNLRHVLLNLRQAIGDRGASPPFLLVTHHTLQFNPAGDYWLDVATFTSLLAECESHLHPRLEACPPCIERLSQAVTLYLGSFLPGFSLPDSVTFEEWARVIQERLHRQALETLNHLARYHEERGNYAEAGRYARRQVEFEPWREEAHQQLMRIYALSGQRSVALAQHAICRKILADELGVEPSAETIALYEQIRDGQLSGGEPFFLASLALSPPAPRHNLPAQLTSFIGRDREIAEIKQLLSKYRLVTLTGAGGSGKTRLAIQAAAELVTEYPDGIWLVELAPLLDPAFVLQSVATVLGVRETPNKPLSELLVGALRSKQLMLVLDNCEHLIEACAQLAGRLLSTCTNLKILATSREVLSLTGESLYLVPTLSLPDASYPPRPDWLMQFEGVRLFVERATAVKSDFALTEQNAPAILQICRRLDGIPLALELAAARVRVLSEHEIAARLDHRFDLLSRGSRAAVPRHQTLRAAIDWSYDLLTEPERVLFRQLSVFAGGFALQAAEAVAGRPNAPSVSNRGVFELLSHLVDKSLVMLDQQHAEMRYRMLETIREYGWEKLVESGEADAERNRHLDYFLRLAEEAEPHLFSAEQEEWFNRLEREHDNLRAALEWSLENRAATAALRLVGTLWTFWYTRGHYSEGRERMMRVLSSPLAMERTPERAKALNAAGALLWTWGSHTEAHVLLEEALAIGQELGDQLNIAWSHLYLGTIAYTQGDDASAWPFLEAGLMICRELGPAGKRGTGWALIFLGDLALKEGNYEQARALYEKSVTTLRELQDNSLLANPLRRLGQIALHEGDYERATALCKESLSINLAVGDKLAVVACLVGLAGVAVARGQTVHTPTSTEHLQRAAQLLGAVEAQLYTIGAPLFPADGRAYDRNVAAVRVLMDEAVFSSAWAEGRAMTLEQAIAYALGGDTRASMD